GHPLVFGEVLEQAAGRAARAGDQDVDRAQLLGGGGHAALHGGGDAHVPGQGEDPLAGGGLDLLGRDLQWLRGARRDGYAGTLPGQVLRDVTADALAGAGDEGHFPAQLQIHRRPLPGWPPRVCAMVYQISVGRKAPAWLCLTRSFPSIVPCPQALSPRRPRDVDHGAAAAAVAPGRSTTHAVTCSPHRGCGTPATAASATAGWLSSAASTSRGYTFS